LGGPGEGRDQEDGYADEYQGNFSFSHTDTEVGCHKALNLISPRRGKVKLEGNGDAISRVAISAPVTQTVRCILLHKFLNKNEEAVRVT